MSPRSVRGAPQWLARAALWCALASIVVGMSTSVVGCGDSKRLRVANSALSPGRVGTPYSQVLIAGGRTGVVSWSIMSGRLPPGLLLDPLTGVIDGTPTLAGSFPFGVAAFDSEDSAFASLTIEVLP